MRLTYRRRIKSDTWHFCRSCSNWPGSVRLAKRKVELFKEQSAHPLTGELCDQCLAKHKKGECK